MFYFQDYFTFIITFDPQLCHCAVIFSSVKPVTEGSCRQGDSLWEATEGHGTAQSGVIGFQEEVNRAVWFLKIVRMGRT